MALGVNSVAAVAASFIGLVIGGLLASADWHLIFLVSVPVGLFGTVWGYARLREVSAAPGGRMDWWGSVLFAVGLVAVLVGLTYGIQPYGGYAMGWTNPAMLGSVIGGIVILGIFVLVERRVAEPTLDFALLRNRTFAGGNLASLLSSIGRGGLLFALIIWLQGIWLPLRGYSFERTPLWSAIFMLPLTAGFLVAGPLAGIWSDRLGTRPFTIGGQLAGTIAFVLLAVLPVNFQYWAFALLLLAYGLGMGAFSSSNAAEVMGAVDPAQRGSGGDQVAQRLASQLDLPFVDRAIPAAVAEQLSVPVASAQARDERREPGALRLLVSAANTAPLFGLEVAGIDFDDEDQFRLATEVELWKLAATSGGVILGRVGAVILAGHPRALHVRVTASRATRCRRVHEYGGLDEPAALRLIDRTDRARAEYAHHLYGADLSDPDLYDLIVATDKLSLGDAAEVVTAFLAVSRL